jgi:hypothetical protein
MTVILTRLNQTPDGMFGSMSFNGQQVCVTVERPWDKNKNGTSCIPAGDYRVTRFKSPHNGDCFLLHDVPDRDMIEIHSANISTQLRGCLAPGKSFATFSEFGGMQGVTSSKLTMLNLLNTLPQEFTLSILNPP